MRSWKSRFVSVRVRRSGSLHRAAPVAALTRPVRAPAAHVVEGLPADVLGPAAGRRRRAARDGARRGRRGARRGPFRPCPPPRGRPPRGPGARRVHDGPERVDVVERDGRRPRRPPGATLRRDAQVEGPRAAVPSAQTARAASASRTRRLAAVKTTSASASASSSASGRTTRKPACWGRVRRDERDRRGPRVGQEREEEPAHLPAPRPRPRAGRRAPWPTPPASRTAAEAVEAAPPPQPGRPTDPGPGADGRRERGPQRRRERARGLGLSAGPADLPQDLRLPEHGRFRARPRRGRGGGARRRPPLSGSARACRRGRAASSWRRPQARRSAGSRSPATNSSTRKHVETRQAPSPSARAAA